MSSETTKIEYICLHPKNKSGLCNKQDCRNKIILEDWENCYERCSDRKEAPTPPKMDCLATDCEQFDDCPFSLNKTACEMDSYGDDQDLDLSAILEELGI